MKYKGIYWALFAPMIRKSIEARFDKALARQSIQRGNCEFCAREGISGLMPALCATDEIMFRLQHGQLHREHTIARNEGVCDYWVVGYRVKEPQ